MAAKTDNNKLILQLLEENPILSSSQVHDKLVSRISFATLKRALQKLVTQNLIVATGTGKATRYKVSESYKLLQSIDIEDYFIKEMDERKINASFNHELLKNVLTKIEIFSTEELNLLNDLQSKYEANISKLSKTEFKKEMERLAIDLSWKSSQIEGNTYSLLETERLIKEKEYAKGKSKEDAIMLLNHKSALDFITTHPDYIKPLKVSAIEDIHSLLIKDLKISRNLRKRRVGISGTNYRPIDNEFQIREALESMCVLINKQKNVFAKALLVLLFTSYIQPFEDGNKRTSRIISNAILICHKHCPISFRTVDTIDYKKAMLIFYEQNNITAFKKIFINQFSFAVNTYF